MPILYGELKRIARENMSGERGSHTLQPTALVHEAWIRILGPSGSATDAEFKGREHFLKTAAQVMRHVLVDHARARNSDKRGGYARSIELDEVLDGYESEGTNVVELDDALQRLAETDPDLARIVELRTFGGLTMAEVASALGVSKATAERRARLARLWLVNELEGEESA